MRKPQRSRGAADFLHQSVSEILRQRLLQGAQTGGTKLPALKELASQLSVSTMTVRRALRTLESEGHVYRIAGVGAFVQPSTAVRAGLRRIGFLGSNLTNPFQLELARGSQRAARPTGWAIQLLDAHWDNELESANIRRISELGLRGALLLPPFGDPKTVDALLALAEAGFPMVLVDMELPGLKLDLVCSDHEAGAHRATRYLLARGHRRVLLLSHPPVSSSVTARIAGYERALILNGIRPAEEWKAWIDPVTHQQGYGEKREWWGGCQAILPLLRRVERPLAVLAVDSVTGWGVYEACRELNLRIPEDVSVVAFDDVDITRALSPPMTVVSQRTDEIARVGIELLEARMQSAIVTQAGRKELRRVLIDVDLVERGSVASIQG